jgi:hypothetical protein
VGFSYLSPPSWGWPRVFVDTKPSRGNCNDIHGAFWSVSKSFQNLLGLESSTVFLLLLYAVVFILRPAPLLFSIDLVKEDFFGTHLLDCLKSPWPCQFFVALYTVCIRLYGVWVKHAHDAHNAHCALCSKSQRFYRRYNLSRSKIAERCTIWV